MVVYMRGSVVAANAENERIRRSDARPEETSRTKNRKFYQRKQGAIWRSWRSLAIKLDA